MSYSAGETATKLGLTKDALRYYEKEGLLPPINRNNIGHRVYSESDIDWIYLIKCFRDMDIPIHKIKRYVNLVMESSSDSIPEKYDIIKEHEIFLKEKIKTCQNLLKLIEIKLEFYNQALNADNPNAVKCMDYSDEWELLRSTIGGIKCNIE